MYTPFTVRLFSNLTTSLTFGTDSRNSRHGLKINIYNNNNSIQWI